MSDWGKAFDEQCRLEGLEVPKKIEQKLSNSEMDPNEENKGFNSGGIGRGGMFGGSKMNAPPPQTSFGATSGTRVGGSYGSTGPDGRGAAIGSSDDLNGGGNIISVGFRKEKPACNFSRGGGFGSNRNTALSPIKSTHEGGRFGTMATKHFDSSANPDNVPLQSKATGGRFGATQAATSHMSVGGRFGSKAPLSSTNSLESGRGPGNCGSTQNSSSASSVDGSCGIAKPSLSSTSVGGAFGSKSSTMTISSIDGNMKELSHNTPTTAAGSFQSTFQSKNVASVGGSFGANRIGPSENTTNFGDSLKETVKNPSSSTSIGGLFKTAQLSSSPSFVGGSFGSRAPTSSKNVSEVFVEVSTELENIPQSNSTLGSFGFSVKPTKAAGGSFGSTVKPTIPSSEEFEVRPSVQRKNSVGSSSGGSSMIGRATAATSGGSFGSRYHDDSQPKSTVGGSFGASKSSSGTSIGGAFGKQSSVVLIPSNFNVPPPTMASMNDGNLEKPQNPEKNVSTVSEANFKAGVSFGLKRSEHKEEEKPTFEGCFGRSHPSNNPNSSPFGRPPQSFVYNTEEKENVLSDNIVPNEDRTKENTILNKSDSNKRPPFGGFRKTQDHTTFILPSDREEPYVPFMSGPPPMRGGFQGAFRGGRGSGGGQMDFGSGGQGQMGRGRGQPAQSFVSQQRSTPPSFTSNQAVRPDPKYKYTKSTDETHEKVPIPADIALLNKFIQKEVKMMKDTVVDVQRQDPKSPLYSISSFRELRLKPEVLQALDTLNFQFPTRIQETALPLLLMEPPSNLIAQAQSGTGKTAAFVLTMLCRIDVNLKCPQCICLAPTLELAKQIGEVVEKMGKYMENLKIHYAIKGGNLAAMRGRKLTEQIVIGTPGITREYLQKYKCIDPSQIRCLVLDEADVMIYHQGFTDISTTIYNMVEEASESVQSMLFSATYDEPVINFATKIIKNAIVVMLKREEQALPNIKQFYVQCASRDSKFAAIVNLYSGLAVASSVIFCHTKASVMWLYENMKARGHQVDVLHGDMTVVERADTIIRFKRGDFKVLITTNVFARGIDVAQVSVVINYDLPIKYDEQGSPKVIEGFTQPDCETYLHRIGRTGRFGKTGIAINLIDSEDSMNMINILENHFQMKIARMDPSNIEELEAIEMA